MGQYLTPPTLEYETKCAIVYYPADSGGFFLSALRGQLTRLEAGYIWQSDKDKQKQIVQIWAEHNIMSEAIWYRTDCDDIPFLIGDEELNINISGSSGSGCGCNCCCGGQANNFLDIGENEGLPNFPIPPSPVITELETSVLCDRAAQIAGGIVEVMTRMKTTFAGISVTVTSLTTFISTILRFEGFVLVLAPAVFVQAILAAIALALSVNVTDSAKDAAEEYQERIKCAISQSTSAAQAASAYHQIVLDIKADYGTLVASLFWFVDVIMVWDKVYSLDAVDLMPQYVGSDCSSCIPDNPDAPTSPAQIGETGYWLIPVHALDSVVAVNGGDITNVSANLWEVTGGANGGASFIPNVDEWLFDWTKDSGTHAWGYQVEVVSDDSGNLGASATSATMHDERAGNLDVDTYRGWCHTDLNAWGAAKTLWVAFNQAADVPLGTHTAGQILQWGGTVGMTARIRLWVVMDETGTL